MEFHHQTLDNGLEVIAECNDRAYSTALAFFVKTGARDESDANSGVSHFLEHMAFKGTPTRTAADVNRQLDEIGTHSNAYTSEEQTVFHVTMLPEYLDRALDILADMMRPSLREDDFLTEQQVIIEEIRKYDDQPPFGAHEKCMTDHFGSHPLGRSVLGTVETVGALTPDSMRDYFQRRYSPGNIVLAAAGHVDFETLTSFGEKYCGRWEPYDAPRAVEPTEPHTGFRLIRKETAAQQYVIQISGGPAATDDDRYAARMLATIVGDDCGSRLFWELVDTGLAEYAASGTYEYQGAGLTMTYMSCDPGAAADNLRRIQDIQSEVQRDGITEAELQQAKNKICSHVVLRSERSANRLFSVGNGWVQRGQHTTVKQTIDAYQAVTCDDVSAVASKYPLSATTTVTVGPLAELTPPAS